MRFKTTYYTTRLHIGVLVVDTLTNEEYNERLCKTEVWIGDEGSLRCILELNVELFKKRCLVKT